MPVAVMEKPTFEQSLEAPEYAGKRIECWFGEVREKPPTDIYLAQVTGECVACLLYFLRIHPIGRVTGPDGGYRLSDKFWFVPDAAYISYARQAVFPRTGYNPTPPDLAVEVISDTELYSEIQQKIIFYLQYGTRMVWVVDPATQTVVIYQADSIRRLGVDDVLEGGEVLPGFKVSVRELFPV